MKSMTEPHIDRPDQPILSTTNGYAPKRARWPGLLGVAVVLAMVIGAVMMTGHDDGNHAGAPDRSAQPTAPSQSPQVEPLNVPNTPQTDESKGVTSAKRAQP